MPVIPALFPRLFAVVALLLASAAVAAPKLAPEADEALTKAEKLLGKSTGDDRLIACIDALAPLETVTRAVPDYAYAVGLHAECLFLTEQWEPASELLRRYIALVPASARQGPVAEKVEKAEQRLGHALMKLGRSADEARETLRAIPVPATPAAVQAAAASEPPDDAFVMPPEPPPEAVAPPIRRLTPAPAPPAVAARRQLAVRLGSSMHLGGVGLGAELRYGLFAIALGTGGFPLGGGLSFGSGGGAGGPYVDLHAALIGSSLLIDRLAPSHLGVGLTGGYDWRPVRFVSFKAGVGGGYEFPAEAIGTPDASGHVPGSRGGFVLTFDLAAGFVAEF